MNRTFSRPGQKVSPPISYEKSFKAIINQIVKIFPHQTGIEQAMEFSCYSCLSFANTSVSPTSDSAFPLEVESLVKMTQLVT